MNRLSPIVSLEQPTPMHPLVFEALAGHKGTNGRLFKYRDRHDVYDELKPLCKDLGVHFTPHMARRWYATHLRNQRVDDRGIANSSSWTNEKSVARYTKVNIEEVRLTVGMVSLGGKKRGKTGGSR